MCWSVRRELAHHRHGLYLASPSTPLQSRPNTKGGMWPNLLYRQSGPVPTSNLGSFDSLLSALSLAPRSPRCSQVAHQPEVRKIS